MLEKYRSAAALMDRLAAPATEEEQERAVGLVTAMCPDGEATLRMIGLGDQQEKEQESNG